MSGTCGGRRAMCRVYIYAGYQPAPRPCSSELQPECASPSPTNMHMRVIGRYLLQRAVVAQPKLLLLNALQTFKNTAGTVIIQQRRPRACTCTRHLLMSLKSALWDSHPPLPLALGLWPAVTAGTGSPAPPSCPSTAAGCPSNTLSPPERPPTSFDLPP